jgi:hypothetical protein
MRYTHTIGVDIEIILLPTPIHLLKIFEHAAIAQQLTHMTPRTPFLFKQADRKIQRQMPEPSAEEEQETVCGVCVWLLFLFLMAT